jgi:4-oxalocrotonate tautomerase
MPIVMVDMYEGRTPEQKKQLVKGITESFEKIGTPAEAVHIILRDHPKGNCAQGGKLASDK